MYGTAAPSLRDHPASAVDFTRPDQPSSPCTSRSSTRMHATRALNSTFDQCAIVSFRRAARDVDAAVGVDDQDVLHAAGGGRLARSGQWCDPTRRRPWHPGPRDDPPSGSRRGCASCSSAPAAPSLRPGGLPYAAAWSPDRRWSPAQSTHRSPAAGRGATTCAGRGWGRAGTPPRVNTRAPP